MMSIFHRTLFTAAIAAFGITLPLSAEEALLFSRPTEGEIVWKKKRHTTYTVEVPADAVQLTIEIENAPVDLDLYARHDKPIDDYETGFDQKAANDSFKETLRISRRDDPALKSGLYYVDVSYGFETPPVVGKRKLTRIPYTLRASVIRSRVDAQLEPDVRYAGKTSPEDGNFRTFTIDVPPNANALRIDLDEVERDLDIAVRHGRQIIAPEDADADAVTPLGRETLVLDRDSTPPLAPGRWFVNVYDPAQQGVIPFAARVRFDHDPPPALLSIPAFPPPADALEHALQATVELIGPEGGGSGTLLSSDGLILTNHHVVAQMGGELIREGELAIGITLDVRKPSVELFRARILRADERLDLSLVEVVSGLYGQPLPQGYRFPYLERGQPARLKAGDPISVIGFPTIGGTGSRASVTLTRGVVSGFELGELGTLIKTDANISPGNSGGSAIDENHRLIGVATGSMLDDDFHGQLGYIYSIDLLPEEWQKLINSRRRD